MTIEEKLKSIVSKIDAGHDKILPILHDYKKGKISDQKLCNEFMYFMHDIVQYAQDIKPLKND